MSNYEKESDKNNYIYLNYLKFDDAGNYVDPHFHGALELIVVISGSYCVNIGEKTEIINEGEMAFVDSYMPHHYVSVGKCEQFVLVFDPLILKNVCGNFTDKNKTFSMFMKKKDCFNEIKTIIEDAWGRWEKESDLTRWAFFHKIISSLIINYGLVESVKDKTDELMIKLINYISENYKKEVSLKFCANEFGYTEKYFSKLFNRYMKMGIREFINRYRIKEAVKLVHNEKMPLCKVCESVGFNSLNTFYRAYAKYSKTDVDYKDEF